MKKKYVITTLLAIGIPIIVFSFLLKKTPKVEPVHESLSMENPTVKKENPTAKKTPPRVIEGIPDRAKQYNQEQVIKFSQGGEVKGKILSIYGGTLRFQTEINGKKKVEEIIVSDLDKDSKQICTMWKAYEFKYLPQLPYKNWQFGSDENDQSEVVARLHAVSEKGIVLEKPDLSLLYVKKVLLDMETIWHIKKYSYSEEFFPMETKGKRAKQISSTGFHSFRWSKRFQDTGPLKTVQYYVPDLREISIDQKVPLVIFLHGLGESGTDNTKQFKWTGAFLFATPENQSERPCFMLAPQHLPSDLWSSHSILSPPSICLSDAKNMILEMMHLYPQIDPDRIYITGLSSGGWGALEAVARWPEIFAAGVGTAESVPAKFFNRFNGRPMWMFYNNEPKAPGVSKDAHLIKENLAKHGIEVKLTEYKRKNHRAWQPAYKTPGLHEWLFKQTKPKN